MINVIVCSPASTDIILDFLPQHKAALIFSFLQSFGSPTVFPLIYCPTSEKALFCLLQPWSQLYPHLSHFRREKASFSSASQQQGGCARAPFSTSTAPVPNNQAASSPCLHCYQCSIHITPFWLNIHDVIVYLMQQIMTKYFVLFLIRNALCCLCRCRCLPHRAR